MALTPESRLGAAAPRFERCYQGVAFGAVVDWSDGGGLEHERPSFQARSLSAIHAGGEPEPVFARETGPRLLDAALTGTAPMRWQTRSSKLTSNLDSSYSSSTDWRPRLLRGRPGERAAFAGSNRTRN